MRRTLAQVTVWGAIAAGLAHTLSAQALGLGEINVESQLNQRFSAVIPLSEIDSEDLETVTVSVAPAEAYERAGIERADYLDSLEFTVRNDRGQPRVVVSSSQIAREPVVTLLVQARWAGGRILREYTVLLDPPQLIKAPSPQPKPAPKPVMEPAPAPVIAVPKPVAPKPAPAPVMAPAPTKSEPEFYETRSEVRPAPAAAAKPKPAPVPAPMAAPSTGQFYGPVLAQETLWSIATKLRPSPDVSMDQVIYALAAANPKTIQRGTTVNKGASLAVPSAESMRALSPAEAKSRLAALRGAAAPAKPTAPASKPAPKPAEAAPPPPAPAPSVAEPAKTPAAAPAPPAPSKPAKSVLDAPAALTTAPASKPAPTVKETPKPAPPPVEAKVEPKPAAKPEVKPEPKPEPKAEPKPEIKPEVKAEPPAAAPVIAPPAPAVASPSPAPAPAPATSAPEPAATAPVAPAAEPAAATTPPPTEPAPAVAPPQPSLSQPLPEEESEAGIADLLSTWGLPIGGLLVLLLGGFAVVKRLGNRAGKPRTSSPAKSTGKAASFAAGAAGAASAASSRLGDTQVTPARPLDATQALEQTQAITQQITQRIDAESTGELKPSAFESTLIIEPDVAAGLKSAAQPSAVGQSKTDFDMTTQLQAETMHISLDANDPVSEADFHLAYGLYDEAILLLKQALAKAPARTDVAVKLAETYFAAGKPLEFQLLAEELKPRIDAGEWSKIAIMGAQLCPGVALFTSDSEAALDADFDLGFDEPEAVAESAPAAPAPAAAALDVPLAFELPDVSIPSVVEITPPPPAPEPESAPLEKLDANIRLQLEPELAVQQAPEEDPASIDFMLGQSITPLGAASDSPPPALDANLLEFDLDSSLNKPVDSSKPLPGMVDDLDFQLSVSPSPDGLALDDAARDLKLEEFSVSLTPREVAPGTVTDEFNTKLDLARAYVEMGDNEMARGLLQEVQQQGDEKQQREAGEMLQRLPA